MQIAFAQLAAHLQKNLQRLYIVHGDEPLQQMLAADAIRAAARAAGFVERSVHTVQGAHFDWSGLLGDMGAQSLFADKKIVDIRIPGGKPGKEGAAALQTLAARVGEDDATLALIALPRLDAATKKTPWFAALHNAGVSVEVNPIERAALPAWIKQQLAAQGQSLPSGEEGAQLLELFADRVEGNLLAAHQEIMKLALLRPAGELAAADIEQAVASVARYDVFKLSAAVLAGDLARALRMVEGLAAEGTAAVMVHWTLAEDIRALHQARLAVEAGGNLAATLRNLRVWGEREAHFQRIVPRLKTATTARLLHAAHVVDGIVKGLNAPNWPADPWLALEQLLLQLHTALHARA